jgi:hypothetical protein
MNNPRVFAENVLQTMRSQSDSAHFQDLPVGNLKVLLLAEQTKSQSRIFLVLETWSFDDFCFSRLFDNEFFKLPSGHDRCSLNLENGFPTRK